MKKHTLPSGNTISVKPLDWEASFEVFQEVSDFISTVNIDLGDIDVMDALRNQDITLLFKLKTPLFKLLGNKHLRAVAMRCLEDRAFINGNQKLKMDYFSEHRGDFLQACFHALDENVSPFGTGLISQFLQDSPK